VIGQCDRRWIAIMSPHGPASTLLSMIDQHAADERLRKAAVLSAIYAGGRFAFGAPPEPGAWGRDANLACVLARALP
jgi:hypothetical protein